MTEEDRSNRPPYPLVALNKAIMKHGARLPLHPLVRVVLAHFGLSPSQLNPNTYKIMAGMHILWRKLFEVDLSMEEVCYLYKLSSKKSEVGYFFLAHWEKKKIMMTNLSSSCEGWKDKKFWVEVNFDPFSSIAGAQSVPRNYTVSSESHTYRNFSFSSSFLCLFRCFSSTNFFAVLCRVVYSSFDVRGSAATDFESHRHLGRI